MEKHKKAFRAMLAGVGLYAIGAAAAGALVGSAAFGVPVGWLQNATTGLLYTPQTVSFNGTPPVELNGVPMAARIQNPGTPNTGSMTIEVATTGADVDGCGFTPAGSATVAPCLTLQYATNQILQKFDLHTAAAVVHVGCGSFAGAYAGGPPVGSANASSTGTGIIYQGSQLAGVNCTTITGNLFGDGFTVTGGLNVWLGTMTITATGAARSDIFLDLGGRVYPYDNNLILGSTADANGQMIHVEGGGSHFLLGANTLKVAAGATSGALAAASVEGSVVFDAGSTVSFLGAATFTETISATQKGGVYLGGTTFAGGGGVIGLRFVANVNSVIDASGHDLTFIPGTVVGQLCSGATYNGTVPFTQLDGTCTAPSAKVLNSLLGARSTAQLDKTNSAAYADVVGLLLPFNGSKTYFCHAVLHLTSGAGGGVKVKLNLVSGTIGSAAIVYRGYNGDTVQGSGKTTTFGADLLATNAVYTDARLDWVMNATAAGSVQIQAAQNTADAATTSVLVNSEARCDGSADAQ